MRTNVNATNVKEMKHYVKGTKNVRQTLPVDEFGKHCLRRGKKGKWTHRL